MVQTLCLLYEALVKCRLPLSLLCVVWSIGDNFRNYQNNTSFTEIFYSLWWFYLSWCHWGHGQSSHLRYSPFWSFSELLDFFVLAIQNTWHHWTRLKSLNSSDMKAGPILFVFFSLVCLRYVSDLSCLPFGSQLTVQEIVPRSAVASDFPQLLNGTNLLAPGPI